MKTKLVPIGNSKGVRLPKAILQAVGLNDSVDLRVEAGKLTITPSRRNRRKPRAGWSAAIDREIAENGLPETIDREWESLPNTWDSEGWQ